MDLSLIVAEALECVGYYISIFLMIAILYAIANKIKSAKTEYHYNSKTIFTHSLLIAYVIFLIAVTVEHLYWIGFSVANPNFIPFNLSTTISRKALYSQLLLYIPLGFLLVPNFNAKKFFYFILPGILIAIITTGEILKNNRVFNINEIIFNIIGTAIGIGLFYLLNLIFKNKLLKKENQ